MVGGDKRVIAVAPDHPCPSGGNMSGRFSNTEEHTLADEKVQDGIAAIERLTALAEHRPPYEAAVLLQACDARDAAAVLGRLNPAFALDVLEALPEPARKAILAAATAAQARQWTQGLAYAAGMVGRLMEAAPAAFGPQASVAETIEALREIVKATLVTYVYVVDDDGRLAGVVTMRDLLFEAPSRMLGEIMLRDPRTLAPEMALADAMKAVLYLHYPVYPVCDGAGRLLGVVRGQALFEEQAIEITAQAGSMVGVDREERISTPFMNSFRFRHPWLLVNLLTAFLAGGVVAYFQGTIDRLVILAAFLPVLAGQSGNTGCQALAVTLRGITLGDVRAGQGAVLVAKEATLGALNGAIIGVITGVAMFLTATAQQSPHALMLSVAVCVAMTGSCAVSGISGAVVPLALKRLGADPATASSIFLTTATDFVSMGLLLGLATVLVR
jgi:magnesium transporter